MLVAILPGEHQVWTVALKIASKQQLGVGNVNEAGMIGVCGNKGGTDP